MNIVKLAVESSGIVGRFFNRHRVVVTVAKNWTEDVYEHNGYVYRKVGVKQHTTKQFVINCESFDEAVELHNAISKKQE